MSKTTNVLIFILLTVSLGYAQSSQPLAWLKQITPLESPSFGSFEQRREAASRIRKEIQQWVVLHSMNGVVLSDPGEEPLSEEQLRDAIATIGSVIRELVRREPSHPFHLGETVVNVTTSVPLLSPVSQAISLTDIQNRNALTIKDAIEYLPGVSVDHKAPRNQAGISIAGFDSRQVPLYQDGIPIYLPFDGFVDLTRYLTSDVAEVQVAKGYSSPLLGPNLIGGVINLVTREPQRSIEGDAFVGTGRGDLVNAGLHVGSRLNKVFFQGSYDRLQSTFYPISGGFSSKSQQPNHRRTNSHQRDERYRGRVAWIPSTRGSYVLSFSNQKGRSGDPPYVGSAPTCPQGNSTTTFACVTPKYWMWPYWNNDSYYFNSNSLIGSLSSIQLRGFYQHYPNRLDMFDDFTYSTMNKNLSSGRLNYEDWSRGTSGEFSTRLFGRHAAAISFFLKQDKHHEQTTTFSSSNVPATTPRQQDRDRQVSFGLQDAITVGSRFHVTLGFSADHLDGLDAQDLSADKTLLVPFNVTGVCGGIGNASFSECTDHVWSYNPVATATYATGESGTLFATFSSKSRFPTLRDRYSYKAGRAIPNPTLLPERAYTWTGGYFRTLTPTTVIRFDVFHSGVRDEIQNISFPSPLCTGGGRGAGCQQAVNVGQEVRQGASLSIRSTPLRRLTLDANYSYLDRRITGTTGAFPTGTPRHKAIGTAVVRLPRSATGILSVRYLGEIVAMSDNNRPLPGAKFGTVDVGLIVPIRAGATLQGGVRNLADRNYYYWEGFPEEGRNWYLTVRYTF